MRICFLCPLYPLILVQIPHAEQYLNAAPTHISNHPPLDMLRPTAFRITVPGKHLHGRPHISADFRKLPAAYPDILYLSGDTLLLSVFPIDIAVPVFFIVIAPPDQL